MSMESILGTMVAVVGGTALLLMIILTIKIYRGEARPEDKQQKNS